MEPFIINKLCSPINNWADLFLDDGKVGHKPAVAVGTLGLVVCLTLAPVGHDNLIVEQPVAGGALRTGSELQMESRGRGGSWLVHSTKATHSWTAGSSWEEVDREGKRIKRKRQILGQYVNDQLEQIVATKFKQVLQQIFVAYCCIWWMPRGL